MHGSFIVVTISIVSLIGLASCAKKEAPAPPPEQSSMMPGHPDIQMPAAEEMKIIVPDDIRTKWKGVILTVMDRETMNVRDYTVSIGRKFVIPGSKIEVQAGEFLPDLKIDGNIYTTSSSDLLNPAIRVLITEDGKEIFKGWLFQKFPSVHPFKHQKFGITLKEPVDSL